MSTILSQHYIGEMEDWRELIAFYLEEIQLTDIKLQNVVRRNSIVQIAEKVEVHRKALNPLGKKFRRLRMQIRKQEARLKEGNEFIEDNHISADQEQMQQELRRRMLATEQDFLNKKYDCAVFLSGILKKRS